MKVFQTNPRLVFLSDDKVYKFFNSQHECDDEVKLIQSSPMVNFYDAESGFTMRFVEIVEFGDFFYTMKAIKGEKLTLLCDPCAYKYAGIWLRCFHNLTYKDHIKTACLFGDYSIDHIYIDNVNKVVSTIDPGISFGNVGKVEIDLSRFIVSIFQIKSINISRMAQQISEFFDGYGVKKIDFGILTKLISSRISKNFEKRIKLGTGLRRFFSAYFWLVNSTIKYYFINRSLKKKIKNEH